MEVKLPEPEDFLKIRETLTRMGIAIERDDGSYLYQSCHILHKRGRYYITHFKEMMRLDGKPVDITENDIARRNAIAFLLDNWGLCELVDPASVEDRVPSDEVRVISFRDKPQWILVSKYTVGKKKVDFQADREIPIRGGGDDST